jgi:hypothetical protein
MVLLVSRDSSHRRNPACRCLRLPYIGKFDGHSIYLFSESCYRNLCANFGSVTSRIGSRTLEPERSVESFLFRSGSDDPRLRQRKPAEVTFFAVSSDAIRHFELPTPRWGSRNRLADRSVGDWQPCGATATLRRLFRGALPSSSGLGRGPLKAQTRVRFPLGAPTTRLRLGRSQGLLVGFHFRVHGL